MLNLVLLVFAFVFAVIAAAIPSGPVFWGRVHLGWLAFAFYVAAALFGAAGHAFH